MDYGALLEGMFTGLTPLKYAKMLGQKVLDSDLYGNAAQMGVLGLETPFKAVDFLTEQIDKLSKKFTGKK